MAEPPRLRGFDLRGRRAIVYGADTPVGAAVVAALREAGATVAVTSSATDGNALFRMKRAAQGGPMEAVDLSNGTSVQVATKKLQKDLGGLDIAIVTPEVAFAAPIAKTADADLDRVLNGTLVATYNVFRSASREIAGKGETGRLLAVVSGLALRGLPHVSAMAAAQAGVVGLVRALAVELGPRGVTVNALAAGWLTTTPGRGPDDPAANAALRHIPLQRFGTPDDLAPLAVYLCSDAAGHYTGQVLSIDGGVLARL